MSFALSFSCAKTLKYAPLPMYKSELVIKQYKQMLHYLQEKTGLEFEIVYHADYAQLLDAIKKGEVDIAHLGPLPYAKLLSQKDHGSTPIVQFLDKNGSDRYTCSFITLQNSKSSSNRAFEPIALTQPLSTCGFLSVAHILKKYDMQLQNLQYFYSGTHSNVVLDIILQDAKSGGVRTSEFEAYKHLGLQELDKTQPFPGFLWVGSKSLSNKDKDTITKHLIQLRPLENEEDALLMRKWGTNIKYGAKKASKKEYEIVQKMLQDIEIPELQ